MIRVGIGGWVYKPWRGTFFPKGLPQAQELAHASRQVTSIEINGTFYRSQKPDSFRRWAEDTPDDFIFSVKAPRYATHRRILAEAGSSIDRFFSSGLEELKSKLGPVLWQFDPSKTFDKDDFGQFLALLPATLDGRPLRHVVEVRHQSFLVPTFIDLLAERSVAVAVVDSEKHPLIADVTSDFIYARLQRTAETVDTGYNAGTLDTWAKRAAAWRSGGAPEDLATIAQRPPAKQPRDVFLYMIAGAKVRAPAAATALIGRL